jgi:hypothetical protein
MNIVKKLLASFDTKTDGFSARKLTAFGYFMLVTFLHIVIYLKDKTDFLFEFLIVDTVAILTLLSVITVQKLIDNYSVNKNKRDEQSPE